MKSDLFFDASESFIYCDKCKSPCSFNWHKSEVFTVYIDTSCSCGHSYSDEIDSLTFYNKFYNIE